MTQLEQARKGIITKAMKRVAEREEVEAEFVRDGVAKGSIAIPCNINHSHLSAIGVGSGLSIKVNANIGTSLDESELDEELKKLEAAIDAKADSVMDLSTGGDLAKIRRAIIANSPIPVGTVPIYQAVAQAADTCKGATDLTVDLLFDTIEQHAIDGVDFITVHAGVTMAALERLRREGRTTGIVSRGGAFLATWMLHNKKENPLYDNFDRLLAIAKKYDVTLSLGDGLRPGSISDATDRAQIHELLTLGELTQIAWDAGVQVMIEGPGHVPLPQISSNIILQKQLCKNAPFYVLGPIVTDIAAGYDHIACAIGGALAGMAGADFLCYVTPSEHLRLPSVSDVKEGVIACRIAAHAADIARGNKKAILWDKEMSKARKALNWEKQIELCIDPVKAKAYRSSSKPKSNDVCTMCGDLCAMKMVTEYFDAAKK